MKRAIRMNESDYVATLLENAQKNDEVGIYDAENEMLYTMRAEENIPFGNKIALKEMAAGEDVIKYGAVIGACTQSIKIGKLVHVHNVKSKTVDIPYGIKKEIIRQMHIEEAEI